MIKWLLYTGILVTILMLQISLFDLLPFFSFINFILLFVVFLTLIDKKGFLAAAMVAGYFLDIYSSHTFGIHILTMVFVVFLSNYIYYNVLTNHRFFPIILLVFFNIVVYHFVIFTVSSILTFLKLSSGAGALNKLDTQAIGLEILYTLGLVSVGYAVYFLVNKNIRTIFLPSIKHR